MNFIENMNLFWVSRKELYNFSNSIPAAVYAFCWLDKIPSNTQWPHEIEDTFYIGMSGGLSDEYLGDKKNKNKIKVSLVTNFHHRMKSHMHKFENIDSIPEKERKKYNLYHEVYTPLSTYDKSFFIGIMTPKPHNEKEILRNLLSITEQTQIYLYHKRFRKLPFMNLAESSYVGDTRKIKDSHSQRFIREIKENNLSKFMV